MSFNKAIFGGNLTRNIELKKTPKEVSVLTNCIAVRRKHAKDTTDFIEVEFWRNTAEFVSQYFKKGQGILVEGSFENHRWIDKEGKTRDKWVLVADEAGFYNEGKGSAPAKLTDAPAPADFQPIDLEDEDLPF